jgi:ferric-dicitrate binding protein FerR (iron transport regulator)
VVEIRDGKILSIGPVAPKVDDSATGATPEVLSFDSEHLSEVVQKFNRYNHRKLRVDPKIAPVRIGGSFASKDPEGFAVALERMLGIKHSSFHDASTDEDVIYLHGMGPSGSGLRSGK